MVGSGIDLGDLIKITARLGELGPQGTALASAVLRRTAASISADAKAFAPVDTGNLRNSISVSVDRWEAEIGPTANYGAYVEFGTSRRGPAAYLGPAFDRHAREFELALGQVTGLALGGH